MTPIKAVYFDGRHSTRHPVTVMVSGGRMHVVGSDVNEDFDARRVRRSLRIANTPRWLYLPGGGVCVTSNNDAVDRITKDRRYEALLHKWESRPAYAAIAVLLVVASFWLLIDKVLPYGARLVAERIPVQTETALGNEALSSLDRYIFKGTKLDPARQDAIRTRFDALARAAGATIPYRLEFRASPVIGPNAFALPAGIIVVTDELVYFAKSDREVLAVLAHELGHVHHRHTMRRLLEGSLTALVVAGVTGDITSAASLAAGAPTFLLQAKYSRDNEEEADAYAIAMLRKSGISPRHLSDFLARLESDTEHRPGIPKFLSSHPSTEQRQALAEQAALPDEAADGDNSFTRQVARLDRPLLNPTDPLQGRVMELLEQREYALLETLFGDKLAAFDKDPAAAPDLERAFATLHKVRRGTENALDEWVRKYPRSYAARVARATLYYRLGWDARGRGGLRETAPGKVRALNSYMEKARADLDQSLKFSGKPYASRLLMMSVARSTGDRAAEKAHYAEAARLAPQSAEARLLHMIALEPRWGGSIREMEAFLVEARGELKDAVTVARLAAWIPEYRAFERVSEKDMKEALRHYDEAIAIHAGASALCGRANVLTQLKRDTEAFRNVRLGLAKARDERYCLELATSIASRAPSTDDAIALLTLVIEVDVNSSDALNARGTMHFQARNQELAYQDFRASAILGNATGQLYLGRLYWAGEGVDRDHPEALYWWKKAAEQGNMEAQLALNEAAAAK